MERFFRNLTRKGGGFFPSSDPTYDSVVSFAVAEFELSYAF
jgi:hypothetical protein